MWIPNTWVNFSYAECIAWEKHTYKLPLIYQIDRELVNNDRDVDYVYVHRYIQKSD